MGRGGGGQDRCACGAPDALERPADCHRALHRASAKAAGIRGRRVRLAGDDQGAHGLSPGTGDRGYRSLGLTAGCCCRAIATDMPAALRGRRRSRWFRRSKRRHSAGLRSKRRRWDVRSLSVDHGALPETIVRRRDGRNGDRLVIPAGRRSRPADGIAMALSLPPEVRLHVRLPREHVARSVSRSGALQQRDTCNLRQFARQ